MTYLASFSVTYLATSLKLAKFSVTERTAGQWSPLPVAVQVQQLQLLALVCAAGFNMTCVALPQTEQSGGGRRNLRVPH